MENLEVQYVGIDSLLPHPKNMHSHSPEQIERLSKIIEYQSFRTPITVQRGTNLVVCGHGRLLAAKNLGYTKVPVIYQEFKSEEQLYAHMVADNAIGKDTWAQLDLSQINKDIIDLGPDLDLDMLGLKDFVVEPIEKFEPQGDEDAVPEIKDDPTTKRGDVWLLGNHRLMCGDSTMIDDVEKLMNGEKADMVFTDPPYGVKYEQGKFTGKEVKNKFKPIANDELQGNDLYNFIFDAFTCANMVTVDNAPYYVWSPPMGEGYEIHKAVKDTGVHIQSQIIWDKERLVLGRADYHWQHEICWYGFKKTKPNHYWCGDRKQTTIWKQKRDTGYEHPTQKPVELSERAILNSTKEEGNIVLELFCGSGSALIGAEKLGRKCYAMEYEQVYVDVIINRWQNYTGKKATLESNGKTYEELKNVQTS